jgi:hypothetical protein
MNKRSLFTTILAISGTLLTWLTLLAPILLSTAHFLTNRVFRLDWLMPAELFPFALAGGAVLVWAAVRAHSRRQWIGWGLGITVISLAGGQLLAVVTGLASGATEPSGWQWVLVITSLAIYVLALIGMGVGGIALLHDLFKKSEVGSTENT